MSYLRLGRVVGLLGLLLALPSRPGVGDEPPKKLPEKPLPVERTVVVRDTDVVFVVDGRRVIPPGIELTLQKGVRVAGRNGGVLEVQGALVAHGISGTPIVLTGLRIELAEKVQQLHLDHCDLEGASAVVTPEGKTTSGMLTLENCTLDAQPCLQIAITKGKLNLMSLQTNGKVILRAVDADGTANAALGLVYGCRIRQGLEIENFSDLTVRTSLLKGSPMRLKDNRTLLFDGNRVESSKLEIEQSKAGQFKGTKFTKCDLYGPTVRLFAPADPSLGDPVVLDKCWFEGQTDAAEIAKRIEDAADDPKNNVKAKARSPSDRPNDFVKADGS